ncbi:MAG: DUF4340 domain-containing protein [Anaerolineae bacterium]|nr:DUF4340 domain-containing protein [Anaerolineae bacterium]MDW8291599.1 DUF4340 domain-containing protein [Anaerolineae bacterium]
MNRRNQLLTALLVAQLVIAVLVLALPQQAASTSARPLLGELKSADISAFVVREQPEKVLRLTKKDGNWVLPDLDDYPAQADRVSSFLDKLVGIKVGQPIATTAASHTRLQVGEDSFNRRVDLTTPQGERTLFFGASGTNANVRLAGSDEVFLTSQIATFDISADASSWINTLYFTSTQEAVSKVAITTITGTLTFQRVSTDTWQMDGLASGETFNPSRLETILSRVASLYMVRPLGKTPKPEYGMDKPTAILTLTLKSDVSSLAPLVLTIGARDDKDSTYVVKSSQSPWYARVNAFVLEEIVNARREDFLQPASTPTPTPEATPAGEFTTTPTPEPTATPTP